MTCVKGRQDWTTTRRCAGAYTLERCHTDGRFTGVKALREIVHPASTTLHGKVASAPRDGFSKQAVNSHVCNYRAGVGETGHVVRTRSLLRDAAHLPIGENADVVAIDG